MPWQLSEFGQSWNTDDLTVDEAERLENELSVSYLMFNPQISITHRRAVLVELLAREMDRDAAREKVRSLKIGDLGNCERVSDDRPTAFQDGLPLPADTPPTDG